MRGAPLNLSRLLQALQSHGQDLADEAALQVAAHAPVGTRDFATVVRDSIRGEHEPTPTGIHIRVVADLPAGTYPIDPVGKKALFWPGAAHPVRHVEHPFTVPSDLGEQSKADVEASTQSGLDAIKAQLSFEA